LGCDKGSITLALENFHIDQDEIDEPRWKRSVSMNLSLSFTESSIIAPEGRDPMNESVNSYLTRMFSMNGETSHRAESSESTPASKDKITREASNSNTATFAILESHGGSPLSRSLKNDLEAMTVGELRRRLKKQGLSTRGKKVELIERLNSIADEIEENNEYKVEELSLPQEVQKEDLNSDEEMPITAGLASEQRELADDRQSHLVQTLQAEQAEPADRLEEETDTEISGVLRTTFEEEPDVSGEATVQKNEHLARESNCITFDPQSLKVIELKRELKRLNLPTNGKKSDLVQRLEDYLTSGTLQPVGMEEKELVAESGRYGLGAVEQQRNDETEVSLHAEQDSDDDSGDIRVSSHHEGQTSVQVALESSERTFDDKPLEWEKMTVVKLREELRKNGLSVTGRKSALVKRLHDYSQGQQSTNEADTGKADEIDGGHSDGTSRPLLALRTSRKSRKETCKDEDVSWPAMPEIEALEHEQLLIEVQENSSETMPRDKTPASGAAHELTHDGVNFSLMNRSFDHSRNPTNGGILECSFMFEQHTPGKSENLSILGLDVSAIRAQGEPTPGSTRFKKPHSRARDSISNSSPGVASCSPNPQGREKTPLRSLLASKENIPIDPPSPHSTRGSRLFSYQKLSTTKKTKAPPIWPQLPSLDR